MTELNNTNLFSYGKLLIPREEDLPYWSVIACDQFTSEPEYWKETENCTQGHTSALSMILPEAYLSDEDTGRIEKIHQAMRNSLEAGFFREYEDAFIYTERTLTDGRIRRGLVGFLDLAAYDWHSGTKLPVRATEHTVPERIPPRLAVRQDAPLDMSHVLLLCDDPQKTMIEYAASVRERLPLVYDFELMMGGGRVRGYLMQGADAAEMQKRINDYCLSREDNTEDPVCFLAGDGNHSLAAAREAYIRSNDPARRYALAELENIHDPVQEFEPIHRLLKGIDPEHFLETLQEEITGEEGEPFAVIAGGREVKLHLRPENGTFVLGTLQPFLDSYIERFGGELDYIHGEDSLRRLCVEGTAGMILPPPGKDDFFANVERNGVLPRKTFSMGESKEKRYYLETARLI